MKKDTIACNSRYYIPEHSHHLIYNMYENKNIFSFSTKIFTIILFFLVISPAIFKISYIL